MYAKPLQHISRLSNRNSNFTSYHSDARKVLFLPGAYAVGHFFGFPGHSKGAILPTA